MIVIVITSAALLAMSGALFGTVMARLFWADDLRHVQELRVIWDKTKTHLESSITAQREHIRILKLRLGEK